jgi:hypothetical protein
MSAIKHAVQAMEELEAMWNCYEESIGRETDHAFMRYAIAEHTAHIKKQLGLNDIAFAEATLIYGDYREQAGELTLADSIDLANPLFGYYNQPWNAARRSHEVAA